MTLQTTTSDDERGQALLRAVGFDRLSAPQRELALAIANRYNLDPMLKHIVMIEGRPYVTRDGLLHVAHSSGQLDGIETTEPRLDEDGKFWRSTCSVYRKDMSRAFTYTGRYPSDGQNRKFAPEMAVKVGEVMSLRRAFDIAAPAFEERWDVDDAPATSAPEPVSLAATIAARAESVAGAETREELTKRTDDAPDAESSVGLAETAPEPEPTPVQATTEQSSTDDDGPTLDEFAEIVKDVDKARVKAVAKRLFPSASRFADLTRGQLQELLDELSIVEVGEEPVVETGTVALCEAPSPYSDNTCKLDAGHPGPVHRSGIRETWEVKAS